MAVASATASLLYIGLGAMVLRLDVRARINQVFFAFCVALGVWSSAYIFLYTAPDESWCWVWQRIGALGRYSFPSIVLHFCLLLTDRRRALASPLTYLALYVPPAVFLGLAFTTHVVYTAFVQTPLGWVGVLDRRSVMPSLFVLYTIGSILLGAILVMAWGWRSRRRRERRQALIISSTALLSLSINLWLDIFLPASGTRLPSISQLGTLLWALGIAAAISRYKLMAVSISAASDDIVARIDDAVVLVGADSIIAFANPRATELLGHGKDSLKGRPLGALFTSTDRVRGLLVDPGSSTVVEPPFDTQVLCRSGEEIPVRIHGARIYDSAREVIGAALVLHDMRLLRQLELEVARKEEALLLVRQAQESLEAKIHERTEELVRERDLNRQIFSSSPDGIVLADSRTAIIDCNQVAMDLFGYTDRSEVLGRTAFEFLVAEDQPFAASNLQALLAKGVLQNIPYRFHRRDGSEITALVSVSLLPGKRPEDETVLAIFKDITDQRQYERDLAAEKERLSVTLRSIGDGVITTGTDGRVVLMNRVAEQLTGWTQLEALGRAMEEVFSIQDAATRGPLPSPAAEVLRDGHPVELRRQATLVSRGGASRPIEDSAAPICDNQGVVIGVVLVFRDVTERLKIEANVLRAQKLESLGVLAGGIAHDFNNILTAVIGNLNLVRETAADDPTLTRILTDAENAAARAKSLSLQLLSLSKGGAPVKKTSSMRLLLVESVEFVLRGSRVGSELEISQDLWNADIDEGQISQVIHNLVLNACQAMGQKGRVRVHCFNTELGEKNRFQLAAGKYLSLAVSDQGVGIRSEDLGRIFDPYFTTKSEGHGLGLPSTYTIVRNHGGHIEVESELGVGSTFTVLLPANPSPVSSPVHVQPSSSPRAGVRILLLEDEPLVTKFLCLYLKRIGAETVVTLDGRDTIKAYREHLEKKEPFDLVILDLTIQGGMGGAEAMRCLRELDPTVRAVVSTGYSNDAVVGSYREHGFIDCLMKPYRVEDLLALFTRCGLGAARHTPTK
jgi:two-component system, cell cycle sensor histidine kinase and response regulator CckA